MNSTNIRVLKYNNTKNSTQTRKHLNQELTLLQ